MFMRNSCFKSFMVGRKFISIVKFEDMGDTKKILQNSFISKEAFRKTRWNRCVWNATGTILKKK